MVLQKLTLENFQGIRDLELTFPDGCSGSIYGDNATGKTTIANAITWLLFDKASTGAKNFSPQTRDANGEVHQLDHTAEGEFILDAGQTVILKKDYHENWKKKRGAAQAELAGHVTDYYINGVPVKENEYTETVLGYCGGNAERMKILTMPDYFPEKMKWEERRKILLEVCGDVTDEDVIASNPALKELPDFLKMPGDTDQKYSIDEFRKITAAKRKEINQKLDSIPERIDEAEKAMPDAKGLDRKSLGGQIISIEAKIDSLKEQKAEAMTGDTAVAQVHKKIAEKQAEIAEKKAAYLEAAGKAAEETEKEIGAYRAKRLEAQNRYDGIASKIGAAESELAKMQRAREELLREWQEVSSHKWNPNSETCPACGQRLPEEKIEEKRQEFNLRRSTSLEHLNERGKTECSKALIAEKEQEISSLKKDLDAATADCNEYNRAMQAAQEHTPAQKSFEETKECAAITAEIEKLKASELNAAQASQEAVRGIAAEITEETEKAAALRAKLAQMDVRDAQEARIKELKEQQNELASAFDRTEKGLHLADLFTKTKIDMLTDRINSRFKTVSFQLFTDQINGGVKEGCEVLVPGDGGRMIPYAYANNAARINAGLEIIGTLAEYWEASLPVIIDNAESVVRPLKIDTQVIRLYVSGEDKALRLVTDKED